MFLNHGHFGVHAKLLRIAEVTRVTILVLNHLEMVFHKPDSFDVSSVLSLISLVG